MEAGDGTRVVVDSRREVTFPTCNTDNSTIVVPRTRSQVTCFILSDIVAKCTAVDQRSFMVTIISMFKECQRPKSDKNKQKSGAAKKRSARHEVAHMSNKVQPHKQDFFDEQMCTQGKLMSLTLSIKFINGKIWAFSPL